MPPWGSQLVVHGAHTIFRDHRSEEGDLVWYRMRNRIAILKVRFGYEPFVIRYLGWFNMCFLWWPLGNTVFEHGTLQNTNVSIWSHCNVAKPKFIIPFRVSLIQKQLWDASFSILPLRRKPNDHVLVGVKDQPPLATRSRRDHQYGYSLSVSRTSYRPILQVTYRIGIYYKNGNDRQFRC